MKVEAIPKSGTRVTQRTLCSHHVHDVLAPNQNFCVLCVPFVFIVHQKLFNTNPNYLITLKYQI